MTLGKGISLTESLTCQSKVKPKRCQKNKAGIKAPSLVAILRPYTVGKGLRVPNCVGLSRRYLAIALWFSANSAGVRVFAPCPGIKALSADFRASTEWAALAILSCSGLVVESA